MNEKQKEKAKEALLNNHLKPDSVFHCEYIDDDFIEFSNFKTKFLIAVILCDSLADLKSEVASKSRELNTKRKYLEYDAAAVLGIKFDDKNRVIFDTFLDV